MRTNKLLSFACLIVLSFYPCARQKAVAQTAQASEAAIEGYTGNVQILSNAARQETTIVLTLAAARATGSNQIVFHVQQKTASIPSTFTGKARVLASDSLLAVLPADGSRALLFKFPEAPLPSALSKLSFDKFDSYGIGRYGEHTALTPEQIQQLVTTGSPSPSGLPTAAF